MKKLLKGSKKSIPMVRIQGDNVQFGLKSAGHVKLTVYNIMGQEIASLVDAPMVAGRHSVVLDGHNLASGIYFYNIEVNGFVSMKKMSLMKERFTHRTTSHIDYRTRVAFPPGDDLPHHPDFFAQFFTEVFNNTFDQYIHIDQK